MKKEVIELVETQEYFQLTINVDSSRIPAALLIEFLRNTDKMFKSINDTLNEKYAIGYKDLTLEIEPFEEGSFEIPCWIKKIAKNRVIENAAGSFLGGMALLLLSNQINKKDIETDNGTVSVEMTELLKNRSTADSVSCIAGLAVHNDKINDLSITYEKPDGSQEQVRIEKKTLSDVALLNPEEEESTFTQSNVRLEIVSPVLTSEPASWKVKVNGQDSFFARMEDTDFLEIMEAKKIAFAKGDSIVADIEVIYAEKGVGIRPKHYIKKVHSFPQYRRISRAKVAEQDLFDNEGDGPTKQ